MASSRLVCDFQVQFAESLIAPDFEVELQAGKIYLLTGPSGAGKTTLLRCLAGLKTPSSGRIVFGSEVWNDTGKRLVVSPQSRQIGFLHQKDALFPHMTVTENVRYGLKKPGRQTNNTSVEELLEELGLIQLRNRFPDQLSVGQRQRVALARVLASEPRLLLLDEPFSALDQPSAQQLLGQLRKQTLDVPTLLVTHDWKQVFGAAHYFLLMSGGRILQQGPVEAVYGQPASKDVAQILGVETLTACRVIARRQGILELDAGGSKVIALDPGDMGSRYLLTLRSSDVILQEGYLPSSSARNQWQGEVREIQSLAEVFRVIVDVGFPVVALLTRPAMEELKIEPGRSITAVVKASAIHLIPDNDRSG